MIKKILLIILGIIGFTVVMFFITMYLAFGPINSSGEIEINDKLTIDYKETYVGDFAGEFYDIRFKNKDSIIALYTFHNQDWTHHFSIDSLSDRTFLFMPDRSLDNKKLNAYFVLSFNSNFEKIRDTVIKSTKDFDKKVIMEEMTRKH